MENLNYYPLRVGKYSSVIVSDTFPNERAIRYKKSEMDSEWEHYGGFIIAESVPPEMAQKLVDAYNEKYSTERQPDYLQKKFDSLCRFVYNKLNVGSLVYSPTDDEWRVPENSAHSFTEGMDPLTNDSNIGLKAAEAFKKVKLLEEVTIDKQIEFLEDNNRMYNPVIIKAIIENLKAIKRWNETPVYHGEIDVAKVLSGLVKVLRGRDDAEDQEIDWHIKKGETAIDMINRFKEEREAGMAPRDKTPGWALEVMKEFNKKPNITAKDVAEAHHAGVNILNRKAMSEYIPQVERDLLVNDLVEDLSRLMDAKIARRISNVIVRAIESMDHLKRKHGR